MFDDIDDSERIEFGSLSLKPADGEDYNVPALYILEKFWMLGSHTRQKLINGWKNALDTVEEMSQEHVSEVDLVNDLLDSDTNCKILPFKRK